MDEAEEMDDFFEEEEVFLRMRFIALFVMNSQAMKSSRKKQRAKEWIIF